MQLLKETKLYAATLQDIVDSGGFQGAIATTLGELGEGWSYENATANDTNATLEMKFVRRVSSIEPPAEVIENPPIVE